MRKDGSLVVIDCRAEYDGRAVHKTNGHLFQHGGPAEEDLTPIKKLVSKINAADPSGTGFFRQNRGEAPVGAWRVATNLCGGGGRMLWPRPCGRRCARAPTPVPCLLRFGGTDEDKARDLIEKTAQDLPVPVRLSQKRSYSSTTAP